MSAVTLVTKIHLHFNKFIFCYHGDWIKLTRVVLITIPCFFTFYAITRKLIKIAKKISASRYTFSRRINSKTI